MPRKKSTKPHKAKVAHSLFDYVDGMPVEAPSDPVIVSAIAKDVNGLIARLKALDSESRLSIVRLLAKGANSTSKLFNVAVFILDKEEEPTPNLFAEPPSSVLLEMELM